MERVELVTAAVLAIISLLIGFGLYSIFFHPLTAELRPRYKGGRKRLAGWLKAHARRVVLIVVLVVAALVLLWAGARFGGVIVERVRGLISRPEQEAESVDPAVPGQDEASEAPGGFSDTLVEDPLDPASGEGEAPNPGAAEEADLEPAPGSAPDSSPESEPESAGADELLPTYSPYGDDSPEEALQPGSSESGAQAGRAVGGTQGGETPFSDPYAWD